jgi:hypothetical protein
MTFGLKPVQCASSIQGLWLENLPLSVTGLGMVTGPYGFTSTLPRKGAIRHVKTNFFVSAAKDK